MSKHREGKIENYLHEQVAILGGTTRKWTCPGVNGVPDRIVFLYGKVFFVEVKTPGGRLTPWQVREHERLREQGATVVTVCSREDVDAFIDNA